MRIFGKSVCLLAIYERQQRPQWLDNWLHGYPTSITQTVCAKHPVEQWQASIQAAYQTIDEDEDIMLVAEGIGVNAAVCWYYQTPIWIQKRIAAMILVSPCDQHLSSQSHAFQAAYFNYPAALIMSPQNHQETLNWAKNQAAQWQAKMFVQPLDTHWRWGMQLMQEMLLSP